MELFYLVPFTGKEEILKKFKEVINFSGGLIVYKTVTDEYEVTIQTGENIYVVVSRFAKRKDALDIYKGMHSLNNLCKRYMKSIEN